MTALADLVPSLKRAVAVPGGYNIAFPTSSDTELAGVLGDALAAAQVDGFLREPVIGVDLATMTTTPDLDQTGRAIVLIYASEIITKSLIRDLAVTKTYKAGPVETSTGPLASVLSQLLRDITDTKDRLLKNSWAGNTNLDALFGMVDAYPANDLTPYGPPWGRWMRTDYWI